MSTQHTQGRIAVGQVDDQFVVGVGADLPAGPGRYCVAALIRKEPDARRLAACWNAFDSSLPTDEIENRNIAEQLHELASNNFELSEQLAAARALQAQLVEALKLAQKDMQQVGIQDDWIDYDLDKRAVAAVEAALTAAGAQP